MYNNDEVSVRKYYEIFSSRRISNHKKFEPTEIDEIQG